MEGARRGRRLHLRRLEQARQLSLVRELLAEELLGILRGVLIEQRDAGLVGGDGPALKCQ
jgi:hypothetical protein